ncbi:MAG TPA: BMC domain-containing protein [Myxococcales bacterium]|nr:BMC domain-containing protein [Myxococcales bacterium]
MASVVLPDLGGPALAVVELDSIARGFVVADALLKRARSRIGMAEPVTPGKYVLVFGGEVGEVEESFRAAVEAAGSALLDQLLLTQVADGLWAGLQGRFHGREEESLGFVETQTVASAVRSADAALKRAEVFLTRLHLARGIGGKGYYGLAGSLHMVQAALEAAASAVDAGLLVSTEIIQRPHPELKGPVT